MTELDIWFHTDQHISKTTESVHAELTPLVCEESVFKPLVYHGVYFLQSKEREQDRAERKKDRGDKDG